MKNNFNNFNCKENFNEKIFYKYLTSFNEKIQNVIQNPIENVMSNIDVNDYVYILLDNEGDKLHYSNTVYRVIEKDSNVYTLRCNDFLGYFDSKFGFNTKTVERRKLLKTDSCYVFDGSPVFDAAE